MIKSLFLNIFWHKKGILKTYGSAIFLSTVCLVFPNKSLNTFDANGRYSTSTDKMHCMRMDVNLRPQ